MQRDALLTQDELDFIQTMHHNPQLNLRDASASLTVNGGVHLRDLLTRLAAHDHVTLQAQFDNQQMTFPLQLVEDEFHAVHLRLGVPTIYEDGPMIRPWRLALEEPVALENIKAQPGALWVHEVSFKGLLVEIRGRIKPPKTFSLFFSPSGYERISVRGSLERETARGLFAYRLNQGDVDETERLRQFILQQHRLAHPEVHA